jgi:4-carboxymuconolactone decarboxylase
MTNPNDKLETGRAIRREVLGGELVDRQATTAWKFAEPYRNFVTEVAWGAIWGRPGLSRRDRSLLCLGMLAAMGKGDELNLHIRGALNNGLTPEELREVFMQVGAYCGAPAGLEAFRRLRQVFEEMGIQAGEDGA